MQLGIYKEVTASLFAVFDKKREAVCIRSASGESHKSGHKNKNNPVCPDYHGIGQKVRIFCMKSSNIRTFCQEIKASAQFRSPQIPQYTQSDADSISFQKSFSQKESLMLQIKSQRSQYIPS